MNLFKILLAVYNTEDYLEKCLDSLVNQTYQEPYEIFIVNDSSTDRSLDICEDYARRYNNIRIKTIPHAGLSAVRNVGIADNSPSEYLVFIDSDDWIDLDYLERLAQTVALDNHPDLIRIITCSHNAITGVSALTDYSDFPKFASHYEKFKYFYADARRYLATWALVIKSVIYREIDLQFDDNHFGCEDWLPAAKLFIASQTVSISSAVYHYRRLRTGALTTLKDKRILLGSICLKESRDEYLQECPSPYNQTLLHAHRSQLYHTVSRFRLLPAEDRLDIAPRVKSLIPDLKYSHRRFDRIMYALFSTLGLNFTFALISVYRRLIPERHN